MSLNPLNYCTLPAAQRLTEKGIVLETEVVWYSRQNWKNWTIGYRGLVEDDPRNNVVFPAPSMAEVWRELRQHINDQDYFQLKSMSWDAMYRPRNNTIDDLIDLLIWVRGQKGKR